jgi:hypothetical protein
MCRFGGGLGWQREGVDDLETVSVRQIVELGLYVDRGRSGTLSVPSKVAFCSTPAALAATFAASIMAGELSVPWTRPVPLAKIFAISTLRTPSKSR